MTKSIISGGVMLVAALAFVVGVTGLGDVTDAALVSWGALFAVSFILFVAFGGFKPFFSRMDGPEIEGSTLANLEGQDQAISRRLVTVGAEDETDGRPLFEDRSPVVPQPTPPGNPLFDEGPRDDAEPVGTPTGFGDALGEQLAGDRGERQPVAPEDEAEAEADANSSDSMAEREQPQTLLSETAPWVAARNETLSDTSTTPHIEVEESPAWMLPSEGESDAEQTRDAAQEEAAEEPSEATLDTEAESDGETKMDADPIEPDETDVTAEEDVPEADAAETDSGETDSGETATDVTETDDVEAQDSEPDSSEPAVPEDETGAESSTQDPADAEPIDSHADRDGDNNGIELVEVDTEVVPTPATDDAVITELESFDQNGSAQLPVVVTTPAPLELHTYSPSEIMAVVRTQEAELVDTLIDEGVLTTSGPITDRDVRTMLFVAVSSNELIDVLTASSGDGGPAELNS